VSCATSPWCLTKGTVVEMSLIDDLKRDQREINRVASAATNRPPLAAESPFGAKEPDHQETDLTSASPGHDLDSGGPVVSPNNAIYEDAESSRECVICGSLVPPARVSRGCRICSNVCRREAGKQRQREVNGHRPGISTGKSGAIAEMLTAVDLCERGWDVFRAVSQASSCDLVVCKGWQTHRIEVRTGSQSVSQKTPNAASYRGEHRADTLALVLRNPHQIVYVPELPDPREIAPPVRKRIQMKA